MYVLSSKSLAKLALSISIPEISVRHYMLQNFAGIGNWYTFKINKLDIRTRTYTGHLVLCTLILSTKYLSSQGK